MQTQKQSLQQRSYCSSGGSLLLRNVFVELVGCTCSPRPPRSPALLGQQEEGAIHGRVKGSKKMARHVHTMIRVGGLGSEPCVNYRQ